MPVYFYGLQAFTSTITIHRYSRLCVIQSSYLTVLLKLSNVYGLAWDISRDIDSYSCIAIRIMRTYYMRAHVPTEMYMMVN